MRAKRSRLKSGRLSDHTTADDARRYRDAEEVELWKARDPISRIKNYMKSRKIWDDSKQAKLEEEADEAVSAAVRRAEGIEPPTKDDIFNWMYAELPESLALQRDTMRTSSIGQDPTQIEAVESSQQA